MASWLAVAALVLAACTSGTNGTPVELSWRFVDGRDCDLTGVSEILIRGAGPAPIQAVCRAGLAPDAHFELVVPNRPATLTLAAQSITGATLYAGELELDEDASVSQVVTLRFTGGRAP